MSDDPTVVRNDARGRFEFADAPDRAYLDFREEDGRLVLVHTEVDDDLEGQGVGSALVRAGLDDAASRGVPIVPECRFVADWLERHPDRADELDVVAP
jgi:uncharacterized protein